MSAFAPQELRKAFGAYMTGVTVVTARAPDETPVGFTANSFTSVSLDPPLLLVCPARALSSFPVFQTCGHFCVNVLSEDQRDVSAVFAASKGDRFAQTAWRDDARSCPVIEGAAARFSCAAEIRVEAGDHMILVGRIEDYDVSGAPGLGYANGAYFQLSLERRAQEAPGEARTSRVSAIIAADERVLLRETPEGFTLPGTTWNTPGPQTSSHGPRSPGRGSCCRRPRWGTSIRSTIAATVRS